MCVCVRERERERAVTHSSSQEADSEAGSEAYRRAKDKQKKEEHLQQLQRSTGGSGRSHWAKQQGERRLARMGLWLPARAPDELDTTTIGASTVRSSGQAR